MALSGSITNYFQGARSKFHIILDWSATQSILNNTSTITAKVYVKPEGAIVANATKSGSITIAGNKKDFTFVLGSVGKGVKKYVAEHTVTVSHNSTGDLTASIASSLKVDITYSDKALGTISTSGNAVLNNIARASTITTFNSFTIGNSIPWAVDRKNSNFTHLVRLSFGGSIITEIKSTTAASGSLTITEAQKNAMLDLVPTSTSAAATLTVWTYSNGTQIGGASTKTATATVGSDVVPSLSSLKITQATTSIQNQFSAYIQSKSTAKLEIIGAAGSRGSSIASYRISGGGFSYNTTSATTGVIAATGTITFSATVTDRRGRSASKSASITVVPYTPPSISSFKIKRTNVAGVNPPEVWNGIWANVAAQATGFSHKVGTTEKNTLKVFIDQKNKSTGAWQQMYTVNSSISESGRIISKVDTTLTTPSGGTAAQGYLATDSYDFRLRVTDFFEVGVSSVSTLPVGTVMLDLGDENMGVGKFWERGTIDAKGQIYQNNGEAVLSAGNIINLIYPIGSIYTSTKNVSPSSFLGGTWAVFGTGRTLVGVDTSQTEFNTVRKTGGHKELQSHTHGFSGTTGGGGAHNHQSRGFYQQRDGKAIPGQRVMANVTVAGDPLDTNSLVAAPNHTHSFSGTTGSAGTGNAGNLQPYITVYMWERTA